MDQASASPAASCAHNPAAPRTLLSWQLFEDQAQTVGPPPARSSPRSEPHSEPVHIVPRPSSPALCQSDAKGYLLPDFYSGCAPRISGRLTEGLLLWRSHPDLHRADLNRPDPRLDRALGTMTMPNDAAATVRQPEIFHGGEERLGLHLDSLCQQSAGAVSKDIR